MRRLSPHLSYANVMATIAVFVALSGSAYAAATITGRDVKDGSLSGRDIKQGTLQSGDIKDGTLRRQDFFPGVLSTAGGLTTPLGQSEGAAGAAGPQGPQGEQGQAGADGKDGARGPAGADGKNGIDGKDGAPGAPGKDGTNGTNGTNGAPGTPGTNGTNGTNGTAVAYGTLNGPSVYDEKNISNSNVTNPAQGVYCLKGLTFSFKSMVATVVGPGPSSPTPGNWDRLVNVYSDPNGFTDATCGPNTQAVVAIYDVGQAIAAGGAPATFAASNVTVWFEN
jgi:hypothetical protein